MMTNTKGVDTGWQNNQGNQLLDPNNGQTEVTLVKVGQVFTKS
jgi:hypothetical protein